MNYELLQQETQKGKKNRSGNSLVSCVLLCWSSDGSAFTIANRALNAASSLCSVSSQNFLLLYLRSFVLVFLPEALKQPHLLLRICPQETSNEIWGYIFLHRRSTLHLAQETGGLMTLLLTHNVWCVGAEGTGVALPCCSSWFQCHSCACTNLGRRWTRGFRSLCFPLVWSSWSCSDLPAVPYETRELLWLQLPDCCFRLNCVWDFFF